MHLEIMNYYEIMNHMPFILFYLYTRMWKCQIINWQITATITKKVRSVWKGSFKFFLQQQSQITATVQFVNLQQIYFYGIQNLEFYSPKSFKILKTTTH